MKKNTVKSLLGVAFTASFFLTACSKAPVNDNDKASPDLDSAQTSSSDPVLAKIDNTVITETDVRVFASRVTGKDISDAAEIPPGVQDNMLQGLIRARIFSLESQSQLSPEALNEVEAKVTAYRDEMLTRLYIQNDVKPQPVTSAMVEEYYQTYPEQFTIPGKIEYQVLEVKAANDEIAKAKGINFLKQLADQKNTKKENVKDKSKDKQKNWKKLARQANLKSVQFVHTQQIKDNIKPEIVKALDGLAVNEISGLIEGNTPFIVQKLNQEPDQIKPLSEVSVSIRRTLAPSQLSQAMSETYAVLQKKYSVELLQPEKDVSNSSSTPKKSIHLAQSE